MLISCTVALEDDGFILISIPIKKVEILHKFNDYQSNIFLNQAIGAINRPLILIAQRSIQDELHYRSLCVCLLGL